MEKWRNLIKESTVMEAVLYLASFAGTIATLLPNEPDEDGNPIPIFIFRGFPAAFHAFLLCVIFAFTCSLSALLTAHRISFFRLFFFFSLLSAVSAAGILVFATASGEFGRWIFSEISTSSTHRLW